MKSEKLSWWIAIAVLFSVQQMSAFRREGNMNIVRFGLIFAALVWSAIGWAQVPNDQASTVHATDFIEEPWGGNLYDDFNHKWLDPAKWQVGNPQCWATLECVREIKDGQLRLAVRDFGATNSDSGIAWSSPEVRFIDPSVMSRPAAVELQSGKPRSSRITG